MLTVERFCEIPLAYQHFRSF